MAAADADSVKRSWKRARRRTLNRLVGNLLDQTRWKAAPSSHACTGVMRTI
jgi:hypothetical protein